MKEQRGSWSSTKEVGPKLQHGEERARHFPGGWPWSAITCGQSELRWQDAESELGWKSLEKFDVGMGGLEDLSGNM